MPKNRNRSKKKDASSSAMLTDDANIVFSPKVTAMDTSETVVTRGSQNIRKIKGVQMKRTKNIRKQKAIAKAVSKSEKSATKVEKNESKTLRTKSAKNLLNSQVNEKNFNNYINHARLVEIPMGGQKFTMVSDGGVKFSKLNVFLIYSAGSESPPSMLNKENYVPWSFRLLRYAKSRPNGKLIHNSILNGPYVRKMIPEPGDANRDITVTETFHLQTDDELSDKELKQIEADDQAIQTILLGLPEVIYATVDSCETAQEIWLRVQQMMKGSDIGIQEKKAKNKHFPEKIASNMKFLNNLQPEWSRHVTIVHQTKDLHTADYTQLYDFLKYNQKEVDELKAERIAKTQDPLALMANSNNPYVFSAHVIKINHQDIIDPTTTMNMALALMAKA
nr:hypothetical protein [Tanacetum cinerariifolium]